MKRAGTCQRLFSLYVNVYSCAACPCVGSSMSIMRCIMLRDAPKAFDPYRNATRRLRHID